MTAERWLPVLGYEGHYEVSDQGRVRSIDRVIPCAITGGSRRIRGVVLKPAPVVGYPAVALSKPGHKSQTKHVHALVLAAFIGPCPDGMQCCHNNGDRLDARLANLRWDTRSANELDKQRHGTHHGLNKTHCPQGHEYSAENTTYYKGWRYCRTCTRAYQAAAARKKRARKRLGEAA